MPYGVEPGSLSTVSEQNDRKLETLCFSTQGNKTFRELVKGVSRTTLIRLKIQGNKLLYLVTCWYTPRHQGKENLKSLSSH